MAAELFDLRAKVTAETHCALAAFARAHDIDKIHGASLLANCLRAKGLTAASEGIAGASQGTSGKSGDSLWSDDE